jgi:hypothetical protein
MCVGLCMYLFMYVVLASTSAMRFRRSVSVVGEEKTQVVTAKTQQVSPNISASYLQLMTCCCCWNKAPSHHHRGCIESASRVLFQLQRWRIGDQLLAREDGKVQRGWCPSTFHGGYQLPYLLLYILAINSIKRTDACRRSVQPTTQPSSVHFTATEPRPSIYRALTGAFERCVARWRHVITLNIALC